MDYKIYSWKEIEYIFHNSNILLGNGASIAVNDSFKYSSLKEKAYSSNFIHDNEKDLFDFFKTNDFEQILKIVWQANNVNKILKVEDIKTQKIYHKIRDSLIKAVNEIHPNYNDICEQFEYISNFLSRFKTVISLNYDLIVYWSSLYGNEKYNQFVDCFLHGKFNYDNNRYCIFHRDKTQIYYPHGNLILAYDKMLNEIKLQTDTSDLLQSITQQWQSENYLPLFVSESNSQQKINTIQRSNYLNTIYRNVLPRLVKLTPFSQYPYNVMIEPSFIIGNKQKSKCNTLVIYGFGFGNQDKHIIDKILNANLVFNQKITCIAISVLDNNENYCNDVINKLKKYNRNLHIYFYDSQSSGCWNNA